MSQRDFTELSKQVFSMVIRELGSGCSGSQFKAQLSQNGCKSQFLIGTPCGEFEIALNSNFTFGVTQLTRMARVERSMEASVEKRELIDAIAGAVRQLIDGETLFNDVLLASETELLELDQYPKSPNRGASASRPKRSFTSPHGEVYFKFGLTNNEICAELFSYELAKQLKIKAARTRLARAGLDLGVASYDIGEYKEASDDDVNYSVKNFIAVDGFVRMCLFDYLIMNEDRHGGNWGIHEGAVAPLFDHNYAFGGPDEIKDINQFMEGVTSAFYVVDYYRQRYDALLLYFVKYHSDEVDSFLECLNRVSMVSNDLWNEYFPSDCERLNAILFKRIEYMREKAGEYSARQIDDNEF
jgi:hypothetical protein